jgi:tetraacyldisaccharide 4'-kinase
MKAALIRWLEDHWYKEMYISAWLMPLSMLYLDAIRFRRFLYKVGFKKIHRLPVPVIVVGNITVGGTGKTPLVIWLVDLLKQQGYNPGVISRGYAGNAEDGLHVVRPESDATKLGDEPVLIARRAACPVMVGADRPAAARKLLAEFDCDIIISDDGLQHHALQRDIEIVVIDGERRFGNGYCLPVGPLREPPERVKSVDLVVVNTPKELLEGEYAMQCQGDYLINLLSGKRQPLSALAGKACHAIAGIGNPKRFFDQLGKAGLVCQNHAFPDHHAFTAADLHFKDSLPLIMTEKDAVKCAGFALTDAWYLPIAAALPDTFAAQFLTLLKDKTHGQKTA